MSKNINRPEMEEASEITDSDFEGSKIIVADPEDFQKTKKLEAIHQTKQEVLKVRRQRENLIRNFGNDFAGDGLDVYQRVLARTVALYGSELLPLIEEGLANDTLDEADVHIQLGPQYQEFKILEFILFDGRIPKDESEGFVEIPEPNSLAVYRQLDRIQQKLGLGLELQEQKGPAQI